MKRKLLVTILILGLTAGCGKVPKMTNGDDALVSMKNTDNNISVTELYEKIKEKYALSSLIDMIDTKILLAKYPDKEKDATDYVEDQLKEVKKHYVDESGKYDESALIEAISNYYGISSIDEFKVILNLSYYRNLAVEDYAKSQIDDKQIEKYYNDEIVGDISASHILISPDVTDKMTDAEKKSAEDKALATAKDLIKQLQNGAKFKELAKKYSDDKASASKDGDLGFFNKNDMLEAFENAAYKLKVDEYTTTPVKTDHGYHIILKTGEKDKAKLDDKKDDIIKILADKLLEKDTATSINALVDLRKEYGMKIEDSKLDDLYQKSISNQLISAKSAANSE